MRRDTALDRVVWTGGNEELFTGRPPGWGHKHGEEDVIASGHAERQRVDVWMRVFKEPLDRAGGQIGRSLT